MIRRTIYFSGHVQGVGFRYTANRAASRYRVGGYVRNLDDGRVELVAEGEEAEIDGLLDDLKARMVDNISEFRQTTSPATGQFDTFGIRH